jgi:uncharacterized protein
MRVVVDINHPAHVHYFKNFIWEMENRGHEILVTASEKDISYTLLDRYGLSYVKIGNYGSSLFRKLINIPLLDLKMFRSVRRFRPDLFLGFGSIRAAHASKMLGKPCIALDDTEHARWEHLLYVPFTDAILTPACFKKEFGDRHIRYDGYTELQYLHPNRFTPDPAVLDEMGLTTNDRFTVVRFVSWQASHDMRQHGVSDRIGLVKELEQYGRVLITSEGPLPPELEEYRIRLSPEKIHDLLFYATLYLGEGGTMASEAAMLGTPSIYVSSLTGTMGNFIELEETHDLLYSFTDGDAAVVQAKGILEDPTSKEDWRIKRDRLLTTKIDTTAFMVWFVENYPRSFIEMKEHPEVQYRHRPVQRDIS